jgi:small subunit ribosomal protein S20
MANIKSAIKRAKRSLTQRNVNRRNRSELRVALKTARGSATKMDAETSQDASKKVLADAYSALDRAVYKGVLHKNAAARRKSRLTKLLKKPAPTATKTSGTKARKREKS